MGCSRICLPVPVCLQHRQANGRQAKIRIAESPKSWDFGYEADNPLLEPVLIDKPQKRRHNQNSVVAAIDISMFTDVENYKSHIDTLIDCLKALPKVEDVDEIFVPGELEDNCYDERIQNGIPLPAGTISNLQRVAARFEVELPFSFKEQNDSLI